MRSFSPSPERDELEALQRRVAELEAELRQIYSAHQDADIALRASQTKTRSLLQAIPDLIILISATGVYLDFIEAKEIDLLVAREDRLGKTVHQVLPPALAEQYMAAIHNALATGQTQVFEYELTIHGKRGYYEARVVACGAQEAVFIVRDVTERKRIEAALTLEREKSEKLLLNILPQPIAEQLKQGLGAIANQFDEATILFADIVGFTRLSSQLSATELVQLLNQLFSKYDGLADSYRLEKIKTIGDAYMVVGGIPTPRPDHAEAIAHMALDMLHETALFSEQQGYPIQIRIGINTGPVIAGVIGIKKFIYDLWGDAVNVASRMESFGVAGGIQITEATFQRIQNQFQLERRGMIEIKGKGVMSTYWLKGRTRKSKPE